MEKNPLGGDVNPLQSDPQLQLMLKKLDGIKKYNSFQRWKNKFLDRLETFLYEKGMDPAEKACNDFSTLLKKFVGQATKVQNFIHKGDLGTEKKTVKASLALNEMCGSLETVRSETETLIPSLKSEEKRRGFTKFHLGAVLIRQGFHQYITMKAIEDAVKEIGEKLEEVADKQQHELFFAYITQVKRFCDVMADLNLYEVMMKCLEFAEPPDEDESEDPDMINITIESHDGRILHLELDPRETVGNIKDAIAGGCEIPPERQVLKFQGNTLEDDGKTLEDLQVPDGATMTVEPHKIPIKVKTMDGDTIDMMVDPTIYLSDLKSKLEPETGVVPWNQRLFMKGDELTDNNKVLDDFGIKPGSVIMLEPKTMKVNIEMPDGETHDIEVSPSDTTEDIKALIEEETGFPAPRQVLKMNDEKLPEDETTAKDMGIRPGSTIKVEELLMPVTVNTMDGKQIKIMVDPNKYISDLKVQLEPESGIPPQNQRLFMAGKELDDNNKKAGECGIKPGTVLDLEPASITVDVEMPDGNTHQVDIAPSDDLDAIKKKIEAQTGMAAPRQVLKADGKELPDGTTVKDMGIRDGSKINVEVFKVPVTVNTMDGEQIKVMVDPTEELAAIKKSLEPDTGIPAENQSLFKDGKELDDDSKPAADYGIKAGTVLDMEPKGIKVEIEMPDGKTHEIEIAPSDDSDKIKKKIEAQTGMAAPRQVLKADGKELPDGTTAKDMGIRDGSKINVEVFKVPVTVNTMDGEQIKVMVDPTEELAAIKKSLEPDTGIPAENQSLFKDGKELDDDSKPAADYGIKAGTVLDMEPKGIKVEIEMPDGKTHEIEIAPSDDSDKIKKKIEAQTGMAAPRQVLKADGKELADGTTAKDMGLKDGSKINVEVFKVPVTVNTMDGEQIKVMVDPTEELAAIKKQLEPETGIPVDNQKLFMKGKELDDDTKPAQDYGIKAGTVLDMEPKVMKVEVEMPDGTTHEVEITPSDDSDKIKKKIEAQTGMAAPRQVLKADGEELPNGTAAKKMGLKDGSKINVEVFKVPITVNTMDGEQIKAMIDPTEDIAAIKKQLEPETGVPADNQKLFMKGKELGDDTKPAQDYGIKAGSVLDMEPKTIQVNVKMPDGKTHQVDIAPSDDSEGVKKKIEAQTGMAAPRQVLKSNGKELPKDRTTVKDMGLREGSDIDVGVFKVPVTVNTMDGEQIKLMVDPTSKLSEVKKQLEPESGIPANNQALFMQNQELAEDNKTAGDHGIKAGSVLDLEPKVMKVNVNLPDGKSRVVEISPKDNSDQIKNKIEAQTGMAAPRQLVKFEGKELPKKGTAKSIGIREGSTLDVEVLRVPVTVNCMDGKTIKIMVDPTDKVIAMKKLLEEESGIPSNNQRLFKNGEELADSHRTASAYGIQGGTVLELEPKVLSINVEMPDGKVVQFDVGTTDTCDDLKGMIASQTGVVVPRQVLKFKGKEMLADSTVKGSGMQNGSTVNCELFKIPITVNRTDTGKTIKMRVEPVDTIANIKKMLEKESGLEAKKQELTFLEEELKEDRRTASECGIKKESVLELTPKEDPIVFADAKTGVLFGVDRDVVIEKGALTPHQNNKLDFSEAAKDSAAKDKILKVLLASPKMGVAPQVVVEKVEVEDYDLKEAEEVKNKWGVQLKKREKNKKGEEFIYIDPKTGACGELSRKKYVDMKFITPVGAGDKESLAEAETKTKKLDKYIGEIRHIFGVKSVT